MKNKYILTALKTRAEDVEKNDLSKNKITAIQQVQDMGFEVLVDVNDSSQGYVNVSNPETGQTLVISKDYSNNTWLYGNGWAIQADSKNFTELSKVFDFYGFLKCKPRKKYRDWVVYPEVSRITDYKRTKQSIGHAEEMIARYEKKIEEAQSMVDMYRREIEANKNKINEIFK